MEVFKGMRDLKGYSQETLKQHLSPAWNMEEGEMLTFVSRGPQNQPTWPCGGPEMLLCMVANSSLSLITNRSMWDVCYEKKTWIQSKKRPSFWIFFWQGFFFFWCGVFWWVFLGLFLVFFFFEVTFGRVQGLKGHWACIWWRWQCRRRASVQCSWAAAAAAWGTALLKNTGNSAVPGIPWDLSACGAPALVWWDMPHSSLQCQLQCTPQASANWFVLERLVSVLLRPYNSDSLSPH